MKPLLQVQQLEMEYADGTKALRGISFDVHKGEFIAVIGPSGAGKSTLLRSINRLVTPTSGDIVYEGESLMTAKGTGLRKLRSNIGMIFQHYNVVDRLSVLENVLHGNLGRMSIMSGLFNRYSEAQKEMAIHLLKKVGLENEIRKRVDELSGGQRQRVGVCRALAQNPALILADEPIASLDPKSSAIVMESIYENCLEQGIACLVNLHQVDVAKKYATRIIAIQKGQILFDGKPEDLTDELIVRLYEGKEDELLAS
ncbi:phosphonate ABC transporter ATP-binding protein [Lysinibacillus agricola]|uniref:Phosphonate ABC transporter ATP-binding protein n=1 Tax=Lysinibacillus agricola TaxID=2590012 RepID=A0ABX7ALJ2_9BACI|nr:MULTISPECIES: phosphonate ABC transporter ATP-binding protein [Lysinibacillus]KOS63666.1 phosphonate ABC transporter ATP-binding protein [Lysinibacillus sp. FJAT-14222]QQP10529.1 phosphonate ABC transporter ATP-binding protein [Lysinibacillus agricola]